MIGDHRAARTQEPGGEPASAAPGPRSRAGDDAPGPVDRTVPPEQVSGGRVTLMAPGWRPPPARIGQAYGLCFTADAQLVLVDIGGDFWTLPGGTIEPGETPEQALAREVDEEACAAVIDCAYIASQHVSDQHERPFQSRWWARVRLEPWEPRHESVGRRLVGPDAFLAALSWETTRIAARLLEQALAIDRAR